MKSNEEVIKYIERIQKDLQKNGFNFVLAYGYGLGRGVVSDPDTIKCLGLLKFAEIALDRRIIEAFYNQPVEEEEEDELAN